MAGTAINKEWHEANRMPDDSDVLPLTLDLPQPLANRLADLAKASQRSLTDQIIHELDAVRLGAWEKQPPGWRLDPLAQFMDNARQNGFATFANMTDWFSRVSDVAAIFSLLNLDHRDPEHVLPALLLARSHSSFLAAAQLAVMTQVGDTPPLIRSCLECALYGWNIAQDESHLDAWVNREDSAEYKKATRRAFEIKGILKTLSKSDPTLGSLAEHIYETSIDVGAHPNPLGVFGNMAMTDAANGDRIMTSIILSIDPLDTRLALKNVARVGLISLLIFEMVFPDRYAKLGLGAMIRELTPGL